MSNFESAAPFFPPPLPKGGTVGIVSPSKWTQPERLDFLGQTLKKRGYKVVVHEQNFMRFGQLAGPDEARAMALHDMFDDEKIDAVFCARGGAGAILLLDKLDYGLMARNPKPLVGFSDITALLNAITQRTGLVTFYGPMEWNFLPEQYDPRSERDLFSVLGAGPRQLSFSALQTPREGLAEGRLVGGNLCLLQSLIGTPYDWSGRDKILFLEEVEEPFYKLERMMAHLRLAGKFEGLRAVLVGEMVDMIDKTEPQEEPYGKSLEQIMMDHLPPDIPLAFNFPCGHGNYITTLPVGAEVKLSIKGGQATLDIP